MDTPKVLMLSKEYPPNIYGGAGVHVDYLTKNLSEIMEVEVRCFGAQKIDEPKLSVRGFKSELSGDKFNKVLNPLATDLRIVNKNIRADIVHAHTWYTFPAGFWAKKLYDLPLVTTVHSLEPLRPWKREQLGNGYNISSWMEKTGLENSDKVIAVSAAMKKDILKYYEVEKDKVEIIYNGIDPHQYQYTPRTDKISSFGFDPEKPYLLFVGRITKQKGILHLVNAVKDIDEDLQIVLCAGAPDTEEIGRKMTEKINKLKQTRRGINWINKMVNKETIIQLYSHADIFVCPSIYEPFGIINLEAMACQTPVVASAVGGIKEIVIDGETGFLVDYKSGNEKKFSRNLARTINKLFKNKELQKKMKIKGRQRVENKFSWKKIAQQTKNLYEKLL